jgi:ribosomal protein S18 acetylase RimI-like enzyme
MNDDVELRVGRHELLDELEPLWLSLFDHHVAIGAAGLPVIDRGRSWSLRRRLYEELLDRPDSFVLVARREAAPLGYILAHIHDGADDTWPTGERTGEIETLALLPGERGRGLGTRMLDAAERHLNAHGAGTIVLRAMTGNAEAIRFYERRGMVATSIVLMRLARA